MSAAPASKSRARLVLALKVVFALAILALVVRRIPWSDELNYQGDGAALAFDGRIDGEWKAERIRFVFDVAPPRTALPESWRAAAAGDTVDSLEVERSAQTSWQPGMPRVFREVEPLGLAIALGLAAAGICVTSLRWWRLLGAAGCPTRPLEALRLTFIGVFFNIVVPGLTGGDLVKAVMVARSHPERRAAAAISVLVDRLVGVLVLALLGAAAIVAQGERFAEFRRPVLIGLGLAALGIAAYSSRAVRAAVGFDKLLARLPMARTLRQIDEAITIYSRKPLEFALAVGFSLANQLAVVAAITALGRSFGDSQLGFAQYIVVSAIGNIAAAVPLTPGGVGVTEFFYAQLFLQQGGSATIGFAVSIAWRLCMIAIGLFGGLFLLLPGGKLSDSERSQLAPSP